MRAFANEVRVLAECARPRAQRVAKREPLPENLTIRRLGNPLRSRTGALRAEPVLILFELGLGGLWL